MFTVGIFSTHFPYIAFVLFYAYFLVTGVNKAVAGEISSGEELCRTEIFASDTFVKSDIDTYHYFCDVSDLSKYNNFKDFIFKRKINYPDESSQISVEDYSAALFSRPPPLA
jgi:hypothetical protein